MAGAGKKRVRKERSERATAGSSHEGSTSHRSHHESSAPDGHSSSGHSHSASRSDSAPLASPNRKSPPVGRSPPRLDGNRDPETAPTGEITTAIKNIDLGMTMWSAVRGGTSQAVKRPSKPSSLGREIIMGLNTFNVTALPKNPVYQYDILIGTGTEKRGLITKLWASKPVKDALGKNAKGWLFDGNKLAWSLDKLEREIRVSVDLDAEEGKTPRGKANVHRIIIKHSTTLAFTALEGYLTGQCDFDPKCLQVITFADHLLRESPSQKYTSIKRNFFAKGQTRFALSPGIEAFKGVYQSMRIAHQPSGKHCLTVNVDVANGTFWTEGLLSKACMALAGARDPADLIQKLKPQPNGRDSRGFTELKRLRKLHVYAGHNNISYCIDRFLGQTAREFRFAVADRETGKESFHTVYEYFQKKYNLRLQWPDLPLVRMTKKNSVLPIEVLKLKENQRYVYKLDDKQTSQMIKFAVTPPEERWKAVAHGLDMLKWQEDPYLKNYGMKVSPERVFVKARLLNAPEVVFANGSAKPGTSGRWDLKGKKFLKPNTVPLKSWGITVIQGRMKPDKATVEHFVSEFIKTYTNHGGQVENKAPAFHLASGPDVGKTVEEAWNKAGNQTKSRPQMLVFILPDKDSQTYGRIKKSCEARYGVVSQCMQYAHVQKCAPQYISNVCMKFNAKLGGVTCRAVGQTSKGPEGLFKLPTMIIGADVSHAAPGMQGASFASLTMSTDRLCTRYAAANNTNGYRVEMITPENINKLLKPLMQNWFTNVGGGKFPARIIYFRDGVSEGQFSHVLQQEVKDIKALLKSANPALNIPFVVIVASKRHHIRFFPKDGGDRNKNPLPGTLVETGVTHPYENDFYLCAHAAIKGTARPTHYHVLLNEANMTNEELQTLIYEHSYQYIRATTPVSIHPAVYYAHIASLRSAYHDKSFGGGSNERVSHRSEGGSGSGSRSGSKDRGKSPSRGTSSNDRAPSEFDDLMDMPNTGGINTAMWYI